MYKQIIISTMSKYQKSKRNYVLLIKIKLKIKKLRTSRLDLQNIVDSLFTNVFS